jgi:CRISPR-associated protein Cmr2
MTCLLKFQIGPVQDFIAQARSTRDLWSGSYLLSWLVAAGIRALPEQGKELVFPDSDGQKLLQSQASWENLCGDPNKKLLTPNLPNLFVAVIPSNDPAQTARRVAMTIRGEWEKIVEECFKKLVAETILCADQKVEFEAQSSAFLSITWQITPITGPYRVAYETNGRHLDAVRQTRDFKPDPIGRAGEKDSLSGKDHAFVRGKDAFARCRSADYRKFFKHDDDHLSAITLIKRVWHLAYLKDELKINADPAPGHFPIRSTHAIAARDLKVVEEENTDTNQDEKYLAAIAFDGDSIGKWINGEFQKTANDKELREHHARFSQCLSDFALNKVRNIVESTKLGQNAPEGFLIYAGGDDVVALTAADSALEIARELHKAFVDATDGITGQDPKTGKSVKPDASAGVAIAHFKAPLQDLIRAAQAAEKHAKNDVGRPAFSVSLMKRSGAISHWGAKWDSGAIELHDAIFEAMKNGELSGKFPHRVCQLLEPYLTQRTGLSKQKDAPGFQAQETIQMEFFHSATRQGSGDIAKRLAPFLERYLTHLAQKRIDDEEANPRRTFKDSIHQVQLSAIIDLCTTLAFTFRNLPKQPNTAERHAHA